jgi:hypothetical protein
MKIRQRRTLAAMMIGASLALVLYPSSQALALIGDTNLVTPPDGWDHVCSPESITLTPRPTSRVYHASATCWVNVATDKTSDSAGDTQHWVQAKATMEGHYFLNNQTFREYITVNMQGGARTFTINGSCADDPWATQATCSGDSSHARQSMSSDLGWIIFTYVNYKNAIQVPFSRVIFDPALVQAQLKKFESSPPVAPVAVDAVRWPMQGGKSDLGNISWRAGDMSDNKWVLTFDIEYSQYTDGTFTNAGHRVGPGPKQNMSAADANRTYVFSAPSALQSGINYYFRVCAVNDAGRQCSAPVQARQPTQQEKMLRAGGMHVAPGGMLGAAGAGGGGGGGAPHATGPIALGTARPSAPIALGTARPGAGGGTGGGSPAGGNGSTPLGTTRPGTPSALGTPHVGGPTGSGGGAPGGTTIAGGHPPTSIGGSRPGATGGTAPTNGIGTLRPIGPIAGIGHPGSQPGEVAFPDLAIGPAMLVHDQRVMWGSATTLNLRADATRTCPLPVSFQFRNAGSGPAQNVTAEIRDGLNAMQPIAVENLASMVAGQASSVGGVWRVGLLPMPRAVIVEARVREAGGIHEKDLANNHGAVTLNLTCK